MSEQRRRQRVGVEAGAVMLTALVVVVVLAAAVVGAIALTIHTTIEGMGL